MKNKVSLALIFVMLFAPFNLFALTFPIGVMPPTENNILSYAKNMKIALKNTVMPSHNSSEKEQAMYYKKTLAEPLGKLGYNFDKTIKDYAQKFLSKEVTGDKNPQVATLMYGVILIPMEMRVLLSNQGVISKETRKVLDELSAMQKIEAEKRKQEAEEKALKEKEEKALIEKQKLETEQKAREEKERVEKERELKVKLERFEKIKGVYTSHGSSGELNIPIVTEDSIKFSMTEKGSSTLPPCKIDDKTAQLQYSDYYGFTAIFEEGDKKDNVTYCKITMKFDKDNYNLVGIHQDGLCRSYCGRGATLPTWYKKPI